MDAQYSPDQVRKCMALWGMLAGMYEDTLWWMSQLDNHSYFAKAWLIPWTMHGQHGIMVAASTPESNRAFKESVLVNEQNGVISMPEWLYFEVFWYPNLCLFNIAGLTDPMYGVYRQPQPLGDILSGVFAARGIHNWQQRFCYLVDGSYHQPFRALLREVGVFHWAEVTVGISWFGYMGLDLYIKMFSGGMPAPAHEAHWLLNCEEPPDTRYFRAPEDWYMCRTWISKGQRDSISEYDLRDVRAHTALYTSPKGAGKGKGKAVLSRL
jgi:hypothetical protein